jgi:hypothetical protein
VLDRPGLAILIALESSAVRVQAAPHNPRWLQRALAWVNARVAASAQPVAAR